ncbi:hypothetical protein HD806DRAFT_481177 [Xylariaceae sp. AK1471]|nr:hypothetical protein HD806DRAFT_481177 [Xylariaceae sp. AK1471]
MYPLALGSTKASFLFLYKRIFSISGKTRVLLITTIIIVAAWTVALFFAELFQCRTKFWANWGSTHDIRTQCTMTTKIVFAVCLTDFLLDLTIIIMPIPLIWQLSLSTRRKLGVISIFLLGAVTVAASLLRLILVAPLVFTPHDADANHRFVSITTSLYWGMVESSIGIFVACLPTLQFLFRKNRWRAFFGPVTSSTGVSTSRSFKSKLTSKPVIQVDYTVDVAYANKDSNPILTRTEPWMHNNRSEDGSDNIEMQENIFEADRHEHRSGVV